VIEGKASQTARGAAQARAAHQILDKGAIFDDPTALAILGQSEQEIHDFLASNPNPWEQAMRMFMAGRSRFAEDNLNRAMKKGVRQYVVLGAGLDTFAIRNPYPDSRLKVFEVDHPDTQAWKRNLLSENKLTATAIFTPVDFERQDLAEELVRAGFDFRAPACFSWLGVVMYLTRAATDATLRVIGALPENSAVTFDYMAQPLTPGQTEFYNAFANAVGPMGEPAGPTNAPDDLAARLSSFGFTDIQDYSLENLLPELGAGDSWPRIDDVVFRVAQARKARR